jgi:NADH-quinone oxidoreductase subunit C
MQEDAVTLEINEFLKSNKTNFTISYISDLTCYILEDMEHIKDLMLFLKGSPILRFTILTDLFATDFPEREKRFEIVYNLLSLKLNRRLLIKFCCNEEQKPKSIHSIFSASVWYEREIYDMFGIYFDDSPDMRRILTDYGFIGHPLRKDFPLMGYVQAKYDPVVRRVVYEPLDPNQTFRDFDFSSPWQGPSVVLPGDEKAGFKR